MKRSAVVLLVPLVFYASFSVRLKLHLLEEPESAGPVKVGIDAPPFILETLAGQRVDLTQVAQEKKVVVVNFWATWCGPCKIEMPQLQQLFEEYGSEGLEILAITKEEREVVEEFLRERPYSFPILLDPGGEVTERYGIEALPTTIIVDESGKVIRSRIGVDPLLERQIIRFLGTGEQGGVEEGENRG